MHHIRNTLPDIKTRVAQQLQKYNAELQALGGPMGDANAGNVVLSVITEFCSEFRTTIDGNTNDLSLNELSGGARISFVFHELFNTGVKSIDPFDQVKDGDIRTILYNSSVRLPSIPSSEERVGIDGVYIGLNSVVIRWHPSIRSHRQAADQAARRAKRQMLPIGVRRTHQNPHPNIVEDCESFYKLPWREFRGNLPWR